MGMFKRGVYAITPLQPDTRLLCQQVEAALAGGAVLLQYRAKGLDSVSCETQARALQALCQRFEVPFLVNDNVALAAKIGADGVHLGREDMPLAEARALLGERKIIGVSCYNQLDLAMIAQAQGADYVAFGAAFPSTTKPDAVPVSLDLLAKAKALLQCPVVAIGGINLDNAASVWATGVDCLAVVGALWQSKDIKKTTQLLGGFCGGAFKSSL